MSTDLSQYVMRNEHDHVLLNPDTYVGSVENVETDNWVLKDGKIQMDSIHCECQLLHEGTGRNREEELKHQSGPLYIIITTADIFFNFLCVAAH
jgi:hypothetical protein